MFLAVIRPGKRHLIGRAWKDVSATVWDRVEGEYSFKKAHAIAYAQLVVVNLNLLF
jgi:DNA polymerase III alpha subunit